MPVEALGRKLLDALRDERDGHVDLTARWMAHRLAELMQRAEHAVPDEREAAMDACRDTILLLWRHRSNLPRGRRPLESFEPVLETLRILRDPSAPWYMAHQSGDHPALHLARQLDAGAKVAILACLALAVAEPVDAEKPWLSDQVASLAPGAPDLLAARLLAEDARGEAGLHPDRGDGVRWMREEIAKLRDAAQELHDLLNEASVNTPEDDGAVVQEGAP